MKIIKEISQLRKYKKTPKKFKDLIFYAEHEGYYVNFEGIIDELIKMEFHFIYITSDINDPVLLKDNPFMRTFYIKSLLSLFMINLKTKIFIMTLTDLHRFHLKRSANPVHYLYLFHSMVSTHLMYLEGAFDHYDSILCIGDFQVDEIRKYEELKKLKPKKLLTGGYYRLERIYDKYKSIDKKDSPERKKQILIAPSWGDKNLLEMYGEKIVAELLSKNFKVVVRPHPETIIRHPDLIEGLNKKYHSNPDFLLEKSVSTDDSLLNSDLLICDCSGVALEYAFGTERPVLFVDVPYKIRNKNYLDLELEPVELFLRDKIGILLKVDKIDEIENSIDYLIIHSDEYKKNIIEIRQKYISSFGESSKIGVKHILDVLNR